MRVCACACYPLIRTLGSRRRLMRFGLSLRFNRSKVSPVQRLVFDFEGRCASHVLQRLNAVIDLDQMLSHQSLRSRQHTRTHGHSFGTSDREIDAKQRHSHIWTRARTLERAIAASSTSS